MYVENKYSSLISMVQLRVLLAAGVTWHRSRSYTAQVTWFPSNHNCVYITHDCHETQI